MYYEQQILRQKFIKKKFKAEIPPKFHLSEANNSIQMTFYKYTWTSNKQSHNSEVVKCVHHC